MLIPYRVLKRTKELVYGCELWQEKGVYCVGEPGDLVLGGCFLVEWRVICLAQLGSVRSSIYVARTHFLPPTKAFGEYFLVGIPGVFLEHLQTSGR